jgi:outer membrane receptor protein involved in Fe transport
MNPLYAPRALDPAHVLSRIGRASIRAALALALALLVPLAPARAGDLADEADLHFELAADRFRAHDYKGALEHFLASNRLVPNRNVVANIGATYAALKQWPEAYRYYQQALEAETDASQKAALQKAMEKVAPQVAVLRVVTQPPGATVYIDRRDLGARGQTPAVLGFAKGSLRVMVELEGFESPEPVTVDLEPGRERVVELKLPRVVGTVKLTGTPAGATVTVENMSDTGCALPCDLQLPPGRRTLQVRKEGFLPSYRRVEVPAKASIAADFVLAPVTGGLVVNADERGASVEVDGRLVGFAPVVLEVPVGERKVKLSYPGFQVLETSVTVKAGEQARLELSLAPIEEVSAASRTAEKLEDAPSSVTVISGNELRAMGYPTLWEALRGVRGVFLNDDHSYQSVGMRGFGPAGSYGNRILVLQDGHSMNDDWLGSSYVGYDGRADLGDIERIEIVRGPGSVLYGTSAVTGVINLVSRGHEGGRETSATLGTDQSGLLRARAGLRSPLGEGAGLAASVSGVAGTGQDWYFADYAKAGLPATSRGSDGVRAGNASLQLWWKDLTLAASYNVRRKQLPSGQNDTLVYDDPTRYIDSRGYAELRYAPKLSDSVELFARAYLDYYHYDSYAETPDPDPVKSGSTYSYYWGTWAGAEARLTLRPHQSLRVMVGGEGQDHLRVQQFATSASTGEPQVAYLDTKTPFTLGAGYLLADWSPVKAFHLSAGARLDAYSTFGSSVNPRVALIVKPYEAGTTKLMLGKAFRAPSVYELYSCDPTCALRPETLWGAELEHTHRFSGEASEWSVIGAVYASRVTDLIQFTAATGAGAVVNTAQPVRSGGAEVELRREWRSGVFFTANYAIQRTEYEPLDGQDPALRLREVPNSPTHSGGLRLSLPVVGRALRLTTRLSAEGGRFNRFDQPADPLQLRTKPSLVWDVVLSGEAPDLHARWSAGLYNAGDTQWSVPLSPLFSKLVESPQAGRSFVGQLTLSY